MLAVLQFGGNSKIRNFNNSLFRCQDVGALNVSMDNIASVKVFETPQNLLDVDSNNGLSKTSSMAFYQLFK